MATTNSPPTQAGQEGYQLAVSTYDRAAGMLVSLLVLVGTIAVFLLFLWLASRVRHRPAPVPVILESIGGRGDNPAGFARDWEPPGSEEFPDILEPQVQRTLANVSQAARAATLMNTALDAVMSGPSAGLGDARPEGPEGEGTGWGVPRHERWEIVFDQGRTLDAYAKQLDFFGIELAAMGTTKTITYAAHLSRANPSVRSGLGSEEKRLYFRWRQGPLREADLQLLQKAGVPTAGRLVVQFCPPDTENRLAFIEKERAGNRPISDIRKTIFGVRPDGDGYIFFVLNQYYR